MELGSETACVAVVVTKVRGAETNLVEEKKEEKNISRTADIGTVERQNNSIIHDVINEAEARSLSNIKIKIGDIKETIASLNSTDQIEKVFKGKIRELNATIQSLRVREEEVPKSEAVVGLPIVTAWPESDRVEGGGEEESEEVINQVDDQRDDPEIEESSLLDTDLASPPPMTLRETDEKKAIHVNLSEQAPEEIFGDTLKTRILNSAGSDQNDLNSGHMSDMKANTEANIHSESSPQGETTEGPHSQKTGADLNSMLLSGGEKENTSTPADLETTTKSIFEDAPLWIPKSTTFASEATFPKSSIESKTESSTFASTSSTADLSTTTTPNPASSTSPIQTSSSTSTRPSSTNSATPTLSTTLTNTSSSIKYNISVSTSKSPSPTISWMQGSCEEGQVECGEGGGCVRKVNQSRENEMRV